MAQELSAEVEDKTTTDTNNTTSTDEVTKNETNETESLNTNPYFCPMTYFMSSQYNDAIIKDFYIESSNQSYSRVAKTQEGLAVDGSWNGTLADFSVNKKINEKYSFSKDTLSCVIPETVPKIQDLRAFSRTYGKIYDKPIKFSDIITKSDIFANRFELQIDDKVVYNAYFVITRYKHTIIAFSPSDIELKSYTDNSYWHLYTMDYSTIISVEGTISTLIETTDGDNKIIRIPVTDDMYLYKTDRGLTASYNSWDIYVAKSNLYVSSICYVSNVTGSYIEFAVNSNFISYLDTISSLKMKILFIQRPARYNCLKFTNEDDNSMVSSVKFMNNPFGKKNIVVYEYDSANNRKLRRIPSTEIEYFAFPNIYDFSVLQEGLDNDLLIETYEYDSSYDLFKFDNHLEDFMNSLGDNYSNAVVSNTDSPVLDYNPYLPTMDIKSMFQDFIESPYKNDLRGYMLDKMLSFMATDSYEYMKLTRYIDNLNKKYKVYSGTLTDFKITKNGDVLSFKHRTDKNMSPICLFINGELVLPDSTGIDENSSDIVVSNFSYSDIKSQLNRYTSEQAKMAKPISIDLFHKIANDEGDNYNDSLTFTNTGLYKKLFEGQDVEDISLADLVFYNTITGEIYDLNQFAFSMELEALTINSLTEDTISIIDDINTIEYLCTVLEEFYATMDQELIILSKDDLKLSTDDDLSTSIYPNGIKDICNRTLSFDNFSVGLKDATLIGSQIGVTNDNKLHTYQFTGADIVNSSYTIDEAVTGDITGEKYDLYVNGTLLSADQYNLDIEKKIGGSVTVNFNTDINTNDNVVLMHMPLRYKTVEVPIRDRILKPNFLSDTFVEGSNLEWSGNSLTIDLTDLEDIINFDLTKVYLNGARVAVDNQSDYKVTNILHFTEDEVNYKIKKLNFNGEQDDNLVIEDMTLTLKYPYRDKDIYNMNTNTIENKLLSEYCV